MKKSILSLVALALFAVSSSVTGQISPTISVQGTNATLRWASTPGESFVVLYRRVFHDAFPWVVLNASVPASGGIETFYQHIGGVPRVPTEYTGGGGGGGGTPGTPSAAMIAGPTTDDPDTKDKSDKVKKQDGGYPAFPALPDEKEIEKWLKQMLKVYEKNQQQGGAPILALMSSSLTPEQATNNSMGFYVVLNALDDLNGDGIPDGVAAQHGVNPLNDVTLTDSDGDGLTDAREIELGTDPTKTDTDGDGASDAEEVAAGSDPNTPHGLPGVSLLFYEEFVNQPNDGTNGGFHYLYQQQWGVRVFESNRWVYATPSGGQVGYSDVTEWPMQFAQILSGTTTAWTDLVGGGKADITVTTNFSTYNRLRPGDGLLRNETIDGTRYTSTPQITTLGVSTNFQRGYLLTLTAYTNGVALSSYTGITIKGKGLDALGRVVVTLPDNTRQTITPTFPAGWSNITFYPPSVQVLDMDVSHPATGEMGEADENKLGGLVALRRDFNSPVTVLKLRGLSELAGSTYTLDWTSPNVRIWQDAARTLPVVSGTTSFPADEGADVYLEGLIKSAAEKDVVVSMRVTVGGVQSLAAQVSLTVVRAEYDVIMRAFIPYDWVKIPHPAHDYDVAKGDKRGFRPLLDGTYRVQQVAIVTPFVHLNASHFKIVDGTPETTSSCGESRHYYWPTSLANPAGLTPFWLPLHAGLSVDGVPGDLIFTALQDEWVGPVGGNYLTGVGTADTSDMKFEGIERNLRWTTVRFFGGAAEPIVFASAEINWDFDITINVSNPVAPKYALTGKQDGFPAYEIYIKTDAVSSTANTTTVYQWSPPLSRGVDSLFPIVDDETLAPKAGVIK
jgi:hypothetical protein